MCVCVCIYINTLYMCNCWNYSKITIVFGFCIRTVFQRANFCAFLWILPIPLLFYVRGKGLHSTYLLTAAWGYLHNLCSFFQSEVKEFTKISSPIPPTHWIPYRSPSDTKCCKYAHHSSHDLIHVFNILAPILQLINLIDGFHIYTCYCNACWKNKNLVCPFNHKITTW